MNLKDVGFFQKHVEKLVVAVAGLFLLLMAFFYLVGDPYAVELNRQTRGPVEVEEQVLDTAQKLDARLESPEMPFEQRQVPAYTADFQQRWQKPPVLARTSSIGEPPPAEILINRGPVKPYFVPRPPVATDLVARGGYAVLGEVADSQLHEQLVQLVGSTNQPRDFRYASVEGKFDLDEWIARLQANPPKPGMQKLRDPWWRKMLAITGVYLQRQELDPVTGEWGNTTIIKTLPHQIAFLPDDIREWSDVDADAVVQYVKESRERIVRPEFVPIISGQPWLPPEARARELTTEEQRELQKLFSDIQSLQNRLENWRRAAGMAQQQQQRQQPQRRPTTTRQPDLGDIMDPGAGGRGGRTQQRPQVNPGQRDQERRQQLLEQIEATELQLAEKIQQRNELLGLEDESAADEMMMMGEEMFDPAMMGPGMMPPGVIDPAMMNPAMPGRNPQQPNQLRQPRYQQPNQFRQPRQFGQPEQPQSAQSNEEPEEQVNRTIRVWAHDLTVEPGKTYRYRLIVSVLDPLFKQTQVNETQFEQYHNKLALGPDEQELAESPWSDEVRIDPAYYFFLVGGNPSQQRAEVEVWRIFDGAWRSGNFDLNPGDPIGGTITVQTYQGPQELPLKIDALLVDLTSVSSGRPGGISLGGTTRMLYLDRDTNQIATRTVDQDRESVDRIRLKNEADRAQALAQLQ